MQTVIDVDKLTAICVKWHIDVDTMMELASGHQPSGEVIYPATAWLSHSFANMAEEKDFYHDLVKVYGRDAIEMKLFEKSCLGIAYRECCCNEDEIFFPAAETIFTVYRELLCDLVDAGVIFDNNVVEYLANDIMGA